MKNINEIVKVAENKLMASKLLNTNGYVDDAYYLAGYSFELYLKARISKHLDIEDFFDFENSRKRTLPSAQKSKDIENLYKPFKVHDYTYLIILSGLYNTFQKELEENVKLKGAWSIISSWNENCRYFCNQKPKDVVIFIESVEENIKWLRSYI
jgi:HEPN domain-containing protein